MLSSWNQNSCADFADHLLCCCLQTMHAEEFRFFYMFVFFICREQGKRNVLVSSPSSPLQLPVCCVPT